MLNLSNIDDARLVERHLGGDTAAFREIVERHQGLVCALAYSACGDLNRSEDLAQEVFLIAWKQLPQLREPAKLRGWLGGIARNVAYNSLRQAERTPTARAAELPADLAGPEDNPRDRAIGADETALMWNALAALPDTYREPMVLFYREHRSVAVVAADLEISEETARQRLARGRALLTERMAKLVEETLERSAPTPAFAGLVLLGLPTALAPGLIETSAAAGGAAPKALGAAGAVGSAVMKGGIAIKALSAIAALPALMNGFNDYLKFRAAYENPQAGDRDKIIKRHLMPHLFNALFLAAIAYIAWIPVGHGGWKLLALIPAAATLFYFVRSQRRGAKSPAAASCGRAQPAVSFEYRSTRGFLGLPWVHIRVGGSRPGQKVMGWIAIGDGIAVGGLFASGVCAIAPVCIGGLSLGALAIGGATLGLGTVGVVAVGAWAFGGLALGWQAAAGALAFSSEIARGLVAHAAHANDAVATEYFRSHAFLGFTKAVGQVAIWGAFLGWVPPLALIGWHLWRGRGRTQAQKPAADR